MSFVFELIGVVSAFLTIVTSVIAIYIYLFKRGEIKSIFGVLVNYMNQVSLSEIKEKLERLNDYNVGDAAAQEKVVIIFNEIAGQIKGNDKLKDVLSEQLVSIEAMLKDRRKLTEPKKRMIVSELREKLRHLNIRNIGGFSKGMTNE